MKFTITILLFFISAAIFAQGPGHTSVVTYSSNYGNGTQTLSVFKPYDSTSSSFRHPVIIALNGNGERGSTSQAGGSVGDLCNHGATMRFYNNTYNRYSTFIVLSPVLPTSQGLWPAAYVKDVIDYMKANLGSMIDTSQVYVTGLSLGGGGVLNFISDNVRGTYYSNFIAGAAAFSNTADWQDEATFFSHIYDCNLPMIVYGCLDDANNNGSTKAAVDYMLARQNITYPSRTPQIKFVRPNTGGHAGGWVYGYDTTNTLTLTVDSSGLGGTTNRTYVNNPNLYVRLLSSSRQPSTPVAPGCASYITPANTSTIATTTTATLTWNAVSNATSYDVYLWTGATPPATPVNTTSASYAATGLTASALYNWYVVPKNTAGSATGCSSGAFTFTTATPVSPPACTNNTAPANASTIATSTSATLAWNVASGATSYDIFLWSGATPPSTATYNTTSVSYNATGLTAATLYHWYVVPVNAGGSATGCSSANTTTFTTATSNGGSGLQGVYYNGIALTGTPLLTRIDSTINFDLGFLSPAPGTVPTDLYSVRWAGQVQAVFSETYTFYTQADDGIRLWVNGVQLVDNWQNQGTTERSGTISLVAGQKYDIVVEYYENTGGAVAKLLWSSASTTKAIVPASQLFPAGSPPSCTTNTTPANGSTISTTNSATLTWSAAATADSYDIYLWTGATPPSAATYNTTSTSYTATGLTGSTLYNWYVIPKNANGSATGCSTANKTTFTTNTIVGMGLQGVYYNGVALSGTPLLTRIDSTINFDLGFLSPAPGTVPTDLYSVRWAGQVQAVFSETYTFYTQADDGIRLWVNGVQLVDNWQNQGTTERSGTISLVAGQKYDIVVEYYENTGGAVAKLLWSSASTTKAIVPVTQLYPPGSAPSCVTNTAPANGTTIVSTSATTLTWNTASGADSYDIYLWTGATPPSAATYNTTTTSYAVTGLTPSSLYNWYVIPKNASGPATGCSTANKTTFTTNGSGGIGLQGVYYNGITLTGTPLLTRIDSTVNFDLGFLSPAPGTVPTDLYSVRWTGQVQAVFSETYTFYTQADDGIRLWVNGVQLVDNWQNQGTTERSGTISLVAGQKYDIVVEYYENTGGATSKLLWSSASTTKAIIPALQLYPPGSGARLINTAAVITTPQTTDPVTETVLLNPNPVFQGQDARLQLTSNASANSRIQIINSTGAVISAQRASLTRGLNFIQLKTGNLARGVYIIEVLNAGKSGRILKLVVI